MKTVTNLADMTDEEVIEKALLTKKKVERAFDFALAHTSAFQANLRILEILEKEMRSRGYDPQDEDKFGRDIIGEIISYKWDIIGKMVSDTLEEQEK